jgi:2'-5' RNA ligase
VADAVFIMRVFIAIELPQEIRRLLAAIQNPLRSLNADIAFPRLENLHLTLKFLGEISPEQLHMVNDVCENVVRCHSAFSLTLCNAGAFPSIRQPRVLWVGIDGEIEKLNTLQSQLESELAAAGFPADHKTFRPHLTVGRIRDFKLRPQMQQTLAAKISEVNQQSAPFGVNEIVVMQSQLHRGGSIYTRLKSFSFPILSERQIKAEKLEAEFQQNGLR